MDVDYQVRLKDTCYETQREETFSQTEVIRGGLWIVLIIEEWEELGFEEEKKKLKEKSKTKIQDQASKWQ